MLPQIFRDKSEILHVGHRFGESIDRIKSQCRTRRSHTTLRGRRWTTCFYRFGIGANALKGAVCLLHTERSCRRAAHKKPR